MSQEQEQNLIYLQHHSSIQDARISNLETKFEMFMQSMKDSNDKRDAEMRDRDNQRHAEIAELRGTFQSLHNQNIAVIIGVIAIAVAVFLK